MATLNSTETLATSDFLHFSTACFNLPELEKISCSVRGKSFIHPLQLMRKKIWFAEVLETEIGLGEGYANESCFAVGVVLGVQLGSIEHGIETALLISLDDGSDPYYSDISNITILEVLP